MSWFVWAAIGVLFLWLLWHDLCLMRIRDQLKLLADAMNSMLITSMKNFNETLKEGVEYKNNPVNHEESVITEREWHPGMKPPPGFRIKYRHPHMPYLEKIQ